MQLKSTHQPFPLKETHGLMLVLYTNRAGNAITKFRLLVMHGFPMSLHTQLGCRKWSASQDHMLPYTQDMAGQMQTLAQQMHCSSHTSAACQANKEPNQQRQCTPNSCRNQAEPVGASNTQTMLRQGTHEKQPSQFAAPVQTPTNLPTAHPAHMCTECTSSSVTQSAAEQAAAYRNITILGLEDQHGGRSQVVVL